VRQSALFQRVLGTLIADMSLQPPASEVLLAVELTATSADKRTISDLIRQHSFLLQFDATEAGL
jgi:hypothetical protein